MPLSYRHFEGKAWQLAELVPLFVPDMICRGRVQSQIFTKERTTSIWITVFCRVSSMIHHMMLLSLTTLLANGASTSGNEWISMVAIWFPHRHQIISFSWFLSSISQLILKDVNELTPLTKPWGLAKQMVKHLSRLGRHQTWWLAALKRWVQALRETLLMTISMIITGAKLYHSVSGSFLYYSCFHAINQCFSGHPAPMCRTTSVCAPNFSFHLDTATRC